MANTTSITITDTGKRRTTSSSAEETDLVNSGSALTLHCKEITVNDEAMLQTNPVISKYATSGDETTKFSFGEVDQIGFGIPKWSFRGVLDFNNSTDILTIGKLRDLARTKGYKVLAGDLPDLIDGSDNGSSINIRVRTVQMIHRAEHNIIDWTITAHETA